MHIAAVWHGGVKHASLQYARSLPQIEQKFIVLGTSEPASADAAHVEAHRRWSTFVRAVGREQTQAVPGTVLHVHSSMAGGWVRAQRLVPGASQVVPIVFSPHGYSFIRQTLSRPTAAAYRLLEKRLARTEAAAGVIGQWEAAVASELRPGARPVFTIPHAEREGLRERASTALAGISQEKGNLVVAVGRLSAAKDPAAFARIMRRSPQVQGVWVGDGDPSMRRLLVSAGISVTGWLDKAAVEAWIRRARALLVTSSWEAGCPLVIGEALSLGVPVVYRDLPAMTMELGVPGYASEAEASRALDRLGASAAAAALVRQQADALTSGTTQARALLDAYAHALRTTTWRHPRQGRP